MSESALFDLIQEGNWNKVNQAIDQASSRALFYKDESSGNSLLHEACYWEVPVSIVEKLIARGLSPNEPNNDQESPVFVAALRNADPKLMAVLLDKGGSPNRPNKLKETPVYAAAKRNVDPKLMQLLLSKGGDPTVTEKDGRTPVYIACLSRADPKLVEMLLDAGGNPNTAEPMSGWTPLHVVAQGRDTDPRVMELLLDRDGNPNCSNKPDAWTPLHLAAHNGASVEIVKLMLDFGANSKLTDRNGLQPAQLAEKKGHIHLLSLLKNPPLQTRWASNGKVVFSSTGGKTTKSPAPSATRRLSFGMKSFVKSVAGNAASLDAANNPTGNLGTTKRGEHLIFFSYVQIDVLSETCNMFDTAVARFPGASIFQDMNQHFELSTLAKHVSQSKNVIIMLSASYIRRPFTLLELHHTRVAGANVIVVEVLKPGLEKFDFGKVNAELKNGGFAQYLTDDDWNILNNYGIDVETVQADIKFLVNIKAIALNMATASNVRSITVGNILDCVKLN